MLLTVATVEDLERRVVALETAQHTKASTLRWIAGTLVQIQATVDDHTLRFDKIDAQLDKGDARFDAVEASLDCVELAIKGLPADMPGIVGEALRDVLKKS